MYQYYILAKVLTFEIKHKPNHRLKLRMGMHSGQVVYNNTISGVIIQYPVSPVGDEDVKDGVLWGLGASELTHQAEKYEQ